MDDLTTTCLRLLCLLLRGEKQTDTALRIPEMTDADEWKTINGTHVEFSEGGISKGPSGLKAWHSAKSGKSGSKPKATYERIPFGALWKGGSKEEKAKAREIVSKFMSEAKSGNVYTSGPSLGSGGEKFEITSGRGGLMIGAVGSNRKVKLTRENAKAWIKNGATLIEKK